MESRNPTGGAFALALALFALTALTSIFMILTATLVWLSELTGSMIASAMIAGIFFAILASVIYLISLRPAFERLRDRMETVYDVARLAKEGYEWATGKLLLLARAGLVRNKAE